MQYTVEIMMDFTDIHTKEEYKKGKQIAVSEERALELFSSGYHLVRFVKRENIETENNLDNIQEKDNSTSQNDDELSQNMNLDSFSDNSEDNDEQVTDELDNMNFKQLQELAKSKKLDINLANSKEKLKELIRSSEK